MSKPTPGIGYTATPPSRQKAGPDEPRYWICIIGPIAENLLPEGADSPPRWAARRAIAEIVGAGDATCNSGWRGADEYKHIMAALYSQEHNIHLPHAARTYAVLDAVAVERARQHALLQTGHIRIDCADPDVDIDRKLRVLTEELGEVAQAIDTLDHCTGPAAPLCREELRAELIQVAAVAAAIAESLTEAAR